MLLYTKGLPSLLGRDRNIYLLLSISSYGWQIHCSPTYIIDFLDLELCSVSYTLFMINTFKTHLEWGDKRWMMMN